MESEHYIARYIIKKRETFSRIRFLTADAFTQAVHEYATLHTANCQWFDSDCNAFYHDMMQDHPRVLALLSDFQKMVVWDIRWPLLQNHIAAPEASEVSLSWNKARAVVEVSVPIGARGVDVLNADKRAQDGVAKALQAIYQYAGPFEFDDDVPF